jgi:hypothetical protein
MRNFEFYEFAALLTPGVITLAGLLWMFPSVGPHPLDLSTGSLGLILILAYAAGHLIQIAGNLIENCYWMMWGGRPTDWVTAKKHSLISKPQILVLEEQVRDGLPGFHFQELYGCGKVHWLAATRQIYAAVSKVGMAARVDIFNANYGLCRGMAASFLILLGSSLAAFHFTQIRREMLLLALFIAAMFRMHKFAVYYARELFVQFIQSRAVVGKLATESTAKGAGR